jgi:hypothetical protein
MWIFTNIGLSQKLSKKIRLIKLVVVMSAVDWWKCSRAIALLEYTRSNVAWIFLRSCGKREWQLWMGQVVPCACTFDPQVSLAMFTRSAQGFWVTKKDIEHQMSCALEEISTRTSILLSF